MHNCNENALILGNAVCLAKLYNIEPERIKTHSITVYPLICNAVL